MHYTLFLHNWFIWRLDMDQTASHYLNQWCHTSLTYIPTTRPCCFKPVNGIHRHLCDFYMFTSNCTLWDLKYRCVDSFPTKTFFILIPSAGGYVIDNFALEAETKWRTFCRRFSSRFTSTKTVIFWLNFHYLFTRRQLQVRQHWSKYRMMTSSNGNMSAWLALCAGNSPVYGEFSSQRPVTRSFGVFFGLRLNERLSKQS